MHYKCIGYCLHSNLLCWKAHWYILTTYKYCELNESFQNLLQRTYDHEGGGGPAILVEVDGAPHIAGVHHRHRRVVLTGLRTQIRK